ncbi:MAG: response regulator [Dehalococcoidia bacterium]|nr:response regulator [Dehalococcoidia bacterium]
MLVTDDDFSLTKVLRANLEQGNFRVLEANNGIDCIRAVNSERVDMVFLDVMLPDFSGWGILGLLRLTESLRHIPVILSSGDPPDRKLIQLFKPDEFLQKPFDIMEFVGKVRALSVMIRGHARSCAV